MDIVVPRLLLHPTTVQQPVHTAVPSGRLGQPEDVASAAALLASDAAGYINGADIVIDGGATVAP